ncbi:MAG: hypothetical protein ABI639_02705 [Thermoanaerobaculia bacterium]
MSVPPADPILARLRLAARPGEPPARSSADDGLRTGTARSEAAGSEALGKVLLEEAAPLLWRIVRNQLAGVPAAEQEEVHSSALLRLTEKFQQWLVFDPAVEIESFRGYVSATGANGCRAWLRARYPERTRLQNQLRYLLRHDADLALWENREGVMVCGLAAWRDRLPATDIAPGVDVPSAVEPAAGDLRDLRELGMGETPQSMPLPELVRRIFLRRGRPFLFRDLQTTTAAILGIRDRPILSLSGDGNDSAGGDDDTPAAIDPAETRAGAHRVLEGRQFLAAMWSEIRELPLGQRRALLLNLRDDQGRDRLALLTLTGLAQLPEIARLLEISREELESLWEELPLDDRTLGLRFDLTPRQVINLRKSGRARLGRRLRRGASGELSPP